MLAGGCQTQHWPSFYRGGKLKQGIRRLDEGMRDCFGLIFGIVSRRLKLHNNMLFLMEIL